MNHLLEAIMTKISGSALSTDVGGRIYTDVAPAGIAYPHIVLLVVSGHPDDTFTESIENVLIQFSLFSESSGPAEITGIYADLKALFDDCTLTISGATLIVMRRINIATMYDEITTPSGTSGVRHYAVEYEIITRE